MRWKMRLLENVVENSEKVELPIDVQTSIASIIEADPSALRL